MKERGRLIVVSIAHGSEKEHKSTGQRAKELPLEFRKSINLTGLVNTREHNQGEHAGTIMHTFSDNEGRIYIVSVIDTNTVVGEQTARDIIEGRLRETSISHLYIAAPPDERGVQKAWYAPFEVAFTEKGAREGCRILYYIWEKDFLETLQETRGADELTVARATKKKALHIVHPTVKSPSQKTTITTVHMSAATATASDSNPPPVATASTNTTAAAVAAPTSAQTTPAAAPAAPNGANTPSSNDTATSPSAPALAAPTSASDATMTDAPPELLAQERQLKAALEQVQAQKVAAAQARAQQSNDPYAKIKQLTVNDITSDPANARNIMDMLANENARLKTEHQRTYQELQKQLQQTMSSFEQVAKQAPTTKSFADTVQDFVKTANPRSIESLQQAKRVFEVASVMMSESQQQQQQQQHAAPAPVAQVVAPARAVAAPVPAVDPYANQHHQTYQQAPSVTSKTSGSVDLRQLTAELGNQVITNSYFDSSLFLPTLRYPNYGFDLPPVQPPVQSAPAPVATPQSYTTVVTSASAAQAAAAEPAAKKQRLSDVIDQDEMERLVRMSRMAPQGSAKVLPFVKNY